jgi:UDP:flavonoid glycosyltransferase YjiC (YdhE family)
LVPVFDAPPNHLYLGPVLWSPAVDPPSWWDSLPADRPVVYVTLGSSGRSDLLGVVLQALAELPVTVIAATAGRINVKDVPANAFVADYLPGEEAAARAAVVICNGGSPTTQQALAAGKPVVGIASNLDQHLNMEAVERAGAGVLLRAANLTYAAVRDAIAQVVNDQSRSKAALAVASSHARYPVAFNFTTFLERTTLARTNGEKTP